MTVYEWLKTLKPNQLSHIIHELRIHYYDSSKPYKPNLYKDCIIRYGAMIPLYPKYYINNSNAVKDELTLTSWLNTEVSLMN